MSKILLEMKKYDVLTSIVIICKNKKNKNDEKCNYK